MDYVIVLLVVITLILLCFFITNQIARPDNYPPGPVWYLPFVGNAPLLRKLAVECGGQYKAFDKLLSQYGKPLLGLKLGQELVVVASTYPLVKEIHAREEFDGRPDNFFIRLRTMGTRLGITCTDGAHWNEQRSFVVRHLRNVGYGKTKMETQIQNELKELLDLIKQSDNQPLWPGKEILPPSVINILWIFTTGKRIERNNPRLIRFLYLLQKRSKVFDVSGGILSQMPWLRFIAPEKSGYSLIKNLNSEFHSFFMEIIEEHLKTYSEDKAGDDLIYAYIKEMKAQDSKSSSTFTLNQLIMIILDIFIAGSQTTSTTIDLALMITLKRPDLQMKCFQEIFHVLGSDGTPCYSDRDKMPFVEAMLLEVQRFFHIVPFSGPRRVLKTCQLEGYTIPKNTTVLIDLRSVHMDFEYWKDPDVFRPERFLDENNEIKTNERLFPFGAGRRKCLGDQLAKACIFTFYIGILQTFYLKPFEKDLPSLNLLPGITLSPRPYKVVFEKR